jgi:hypothetical protein
MLISELVRFTDTVLSEELQTTSNKIGENMVRNNQVVTGRTKNSLRVDVGGNVGAIWGAGHIDTLETGITAERSRLENTLDALYRKMHVWQANRGFGWKKQQSFNAAAKQQISGSLLKRLGGRTDVFTSEELPTLKRISDRLGQGFVNVKILP